MIYKREYNFFHQIKFRFIYKTTHFAIKFHVKQVGGYTQVYKGGLTFATVREAGHQVPSYQPARAFSLIKHFLDGTPLPDTKRYN